MTTDTLCRLVQGVVLLTVGWAVFVCWLAWRQGR